MFKVKIRAYIQRIKGKCANKQQQKGFSSKKWILHKGNKRESYNEKYNNQNENIH